MTNHTTGTNPSLPDIQILWAESLGVGTLVLDHHLLRSSEGVSWLAELTAAAGRPVLCAADFMGRDRMFLEAEREDLYEQFPVATDWHESDAAGEATTRCHGAGARG